MSNSTLRNISTLVTGNVLAQLVMLAGIPILSRIYAPAEFGVLASYTALAALIGVFSTLRYDLAIVLPAEDRRAAELRFATRRVVIMTSVVTLAGSFGAWGVISAITGAPAFNAWFLTIAALVYLAGEASVLYYWFTRRKRYRVQSTSRLLLAATTLAIQIALGVSIMPNAGGLICGALIGQAASTVFLLIHDDSPRFSATRNWRVARRLLSVYRRMPLLNGPNALVDAARTNGIILLIGARSADALGQYSMALRVVQAPLGLIGSAISQVYYQRMASTPPGQLTKLVRGVLVKLLLIGLVPFLLLFFLAPEIIPWILGDQWADAGLYARLLTPWLYLNLATSPISTVFLVVNRQGTLLWFAIAYMAIPLLCLALLSSNLTLAITALSACMALALIVLIMLVFLVTSRFDQRGMAAHVDA